MTTKCFTPILGKLIRVTALDECGNVPAASAPDAFVITDGFITVNLSAEIEEGTEIMTKKASGALCVNELTNPSFKRLNVEMDFCGVNPALVSVTTNAKPYSNYDTEVAGFTVGEGEINKRFALELWTGLTGAACGAGSAVSSGYLLLPFVAAGTLGDVTIDGENAVTFSLANSATKGGNAWGVGPWDVLMDATTDPMAPAADALPTALDPLDHLLMVETTVAPPVIPSDCGFQPMPS